MLSGTLALAAVYGSACGSGSSGGAPPDAGRGANGDLGDAGTATFPDGGGEAGDVANPGDAATSVDAGTDGATPVDASTGGASSDGAAAFVSMGCKGLDPGNTSLASAVPFAIGAPFLGCVVSSETRYEAFTTPATPAAGGTVVLAFSDIGELTVGATVYAAPDTGFSIFEMDGAAEGAGVTYWFAAAPATRYIVGVKNRSGPEDQPYTLTATFDPANDAFKPNDTEATATPATLGTPAQALAMSGYVSSVAYADPQWSAFFEVDLAPGTATVAVSNVPAELTLSAQFYGNENENYASLGYGAGSAAGASFSVTTTVPIVAGPHYVVISPASEPPRDAYGPGSTPASYMTQPYRVVVTQ